MNSPCTPAPAEPIEIEAIRARARRIRQPWRVAFIMWMAGLTVSTLWPALALPPESPAGDKEIHAASFAVLAILLWQTRWLRWLWLSGFVALAWAVLDEWAQGLPSLNRWSTLEDGIANTCGIVAATMILIALRPIGGRANRLRLARQRFVWEEVFGSWTTWIQMALIAIAVGVPTLLIGTLFEAPTTRRVFQGAILLTAVIVAAYLWRRYRTSVAEAQVSRPCFRCGTTTQDQQTPERCRVCKTVIETEQWSLASAPSLRQTARLSTPALILIAVALVAGIAFFAVLPITYSWALDHPTLRQYAPSLVRRIAGLDRWTTRVIDLTLSLSVLSVAVLFYRARIARFYDRHILCLKCGHDLRGTPVRSGTKTCPECGYMAPIARMTKEEESHQEAKGVAG